MTDVEIIKVELECVQSDCHNKDNRVCDNCRLALPSADIIRAYNNAIKALEEIAELNGKLSNLSRVAEVRLANWQKYEKENKELKDKLEHRNCVDCSNHSSNIKLLKAKEIIRNLLRVTYGEGWNYSLDVKVKAEDFLKEVE